MHLWVFLKDTISEADLYKEFYKNKKSSRVDYRIFHGDTKTIEISPDEAYGPRRKDLVIDVPKSDLPDDMTPTIGQGLRMRQPDGGNIDLIITDINEESITLDANHPLAGHTLIFDLELVEIA